MFKPVRRKDRILEEEGIMNLLETGEYGFLAMNGVNEFGYGIPLNFVKVENHIYFHCAPEGYKLECLEKNPHVSFCVVGTTKVIPHQFTTAYESALVFGTIHLQLPDTEKRQALQLLVRKYSPEYGELGDKYIEKSFHRTLVLRLDITHHTGKCKVISTMNVK